VRVVPVVVLRAGFVATAATSGATKSERKAADTPATTDDAALTEHDAALTEHDTPLTSGSVAVATKPARKTTTGTTRTRKAPANSIATENEN
jgi:hypothetical protein